MTKQDAASEIGKLASRILALAPSAGLYVGIKIESAFSSRRPSPETVHAIVADSELSLRACARKHGVGVGVVRGIRSKARGETPNG